METCQTNNKLWDFIEIQNKLYSILSILFYSILFYSILFYSILFYSILFYSILFYPILFNSILPLDFYNVRAVFHRTLIDYIFRFQAESRYIIYSISHVLFYSGLFYSILLYSILFYSGLFHFMHSFPERDHSFLCLKHLRRYKIIRQFRFM